MKLLIVGMVVLCLLCIACTIAMVTTDNMAAQCGWLTATMGWSCWTITTIVQHWE